MSVFHTYYPFFLALFLLTACNDPFSTSGKDEKVAPPRTSDEVHKRSDTSDSGQHPQISYYPEGSVVINEVMAAQTSHVSDPDFGLYPGWIELRNARTEATDISGWEIRGDALSFADGSDVFVIPEGTVLTAGDFLLLWADAADVVARGVHTNFTFGSRGGDIYLDIPASDAGEATAMDAFSFAEADIMEDVSLGRIRFNQNHKGFILPLFEPTPGAGNRLPELRIREFHELDVPGPSGITASPDNHLWMVSDVRNGSIYKTTQSGSIIEELEVRGEDMEGIAWHPEYETLWVVEERLREIIEYDTLGQLLSRFQVDVERRNENDGLEGIAINTRNHHIFVANEKNPRRLVELDAQGNQLRKVPVDFGLDDEARGLDLSGLHYDDVHDWLWLISDEARAIFVIDPDGRPLAAFQSDVQDLEGITVLHEQQRIAAVSDDLQRLVYFDLPDPLLHLPRRVGTSTSAAR